MRWSRSSGLKWLGSIGTTVALAALLTACGGDNGGSGGTGNGAKGPQNALIACPANTTSSTAKAESGTITLNVGGFSSSPAEDALVQQGLNSFMKKYPNIKATFTAIPGDYETKMRANVASNSLPDVFYVTPNMAQEYVKAGKLLNLSPYMARDNVQPSSFYSSLMTPFDCSDGTVYGIPKDWNTLGLFYNKTMFQQAGLGDPSNWSWTDLQNAAQKLNKPASGSSKGVAGISLPADASRWGAFLFANGGQMISKDGQKAEFNNQAGVQAAQFYTSFELNHTGVQPSDIGAAWDGAAFGQQQAAMTFEGGWMIPFMSQQFASVQYGIAPLPKASNGQRGNLIYTNAWGASASTKHPDAAWKLIQYMTGATYQQQVLHDGFALPTIKSLANDSYFQQNPGVKVLLDGASYGHADFYGVADTEVHKDVANALQSVMLGKTSSVPDALNSAAQQVNTFIQQNLAP